ncbi:BcPKS16, polyketide synthase [Podospora aff. communis PSN243]|uniref:BcPKS16, polyketide synthase n=1 Tax=Podospora aff. communis PSN243 TaxID=3040156 RepID=A0AAV9GEJ4_9PEZI|nr:BcPKS16, polyketide synthase [Podospora aff. communis PSN243]
MPTTLTIFGPQSRSPSPSYLDSIRTFITAHPVLSVLVDQIPTLHTVFALLAAKNPSIATLAQGPRYADFLIQWLTSSEGQLEHAQNAASTSSGIAALPRLAIIQFAQYFQFLQSKGLTHAEFVSETQACGGSFQGYCGGLPAAVALGCARTDDEVRRVMCTAVRLAYAIGLYAELGDDSAIPGTTTIVVRLKTEGQAEGLVARFPHTYISAITDPKSVSIVGPVKQLADLQAYANQQGLLTTGMDIRGKTHNPENSQLAIELTSISEASELLNLPGLECLQLPIRSNRTGARITSDSGFSLTREIVETVLASRCEWFALLTNVAKDISTTNASSTPTEPHSIMSFGIGDCVPLIPFNKLGLRVAKTDWSAQSQNKGNSPPPPPLTRAESFAGGYTYPNDSVAIVGASCRLPGANNLDELWDLLSTGQDRHQEIKADHARFNLRGGYRASQSGTFVQKRKFYGNFVDGIDKFDGAFFGINAREAANMDPQQRMLLELAYEAMESSGYTRTHVRSRGDDVGCFIGASFVEWLENTSAHAPTAYTSTGTIRAFLCGRLSYYFGWSGPAEVIDTACSSSLVAINRAVKAVRTGECSVALAGGVNLMTGVTNFLDLGKAGFLSPTGQCKPFDKDADGYCRAEGAGLVVLKPLKQAVADGDTIMAVIPGSATNQGGLSCGLTVPDSNAQTRLYREVLKQASMGPEMVTYVEAHGTGTQAGDPLEIASVRDVFGNPSRAAEVHIGSIKGNIGHCETAAGVAGLLKVLCMLEHQRIPPQASHRLWNPKIPALSPDKMTISSTLQPWEVPIRASLVNSYGAAGSNAAVLCCEAPKWSSLRQADVRPTSTPGLEHPIIFSAESASSLLRYQSALAKYLTKANFKPTLSEVAFTLSEKRKRHKYFSVVETTDTAALINTLTHGPPLPVLERCPPNPVVLVFGGQSKQTVGLSKQLYEHFIAFRTVVNMCDTTLQELGYPSILPAVFDTANISDIVVLQTGFVAVQYASAMTWIKAGLKIDALVGHSLGELTALAVSGRLSLRDCLKLVGARATLMKTKWGQERGSMLAVFATRSVVEQAIADDDNLEIACYNSNTSHVVSGDGAAVAGLESRLASRSPPVKTLRVDTSHGFHSGLVSPILAELSQVSASLDWKQPETMIPMELCTEVEHAADSPYSPPDHAREPVFFAAALQRIEKRLGRCIFLEAGMDTPAIAMAKRAVAQPEKHSFCALSTKNEATPANVISQSVSALWKVSVDVSHWSFLDGDCIPRAVWLPPYQFDQTTAWLDNIDRAAMLQRELDERPVQVAGLAGTADASAKPKPMMVAPLPETDKSGSKRFRVLVEGERFRTIVAGHAVRNRPLCPASVYLECAAMALDLLIGHDGASVQNSFLDFEGLDIQAPLGVATENVEVVMKELGGSWWEFTLLSRDAAKKPERATLHAKGRISTSSPASKLVTMARLVDKQVQLLDANSRDAERMLSKRAYDLFSRVVSYDKFLEGIACITMSGTEAVATVQIPSGQPGVDESTVAAACDAVTLDNFIQVVGLLMNTSDTIGKSEVMVCTGVENSMIAKGCNMVDCRSWKVHASYTPTSPSQAIGDVFAFSAKDGSVAAAFTGCRFTKLDMARLEKLLDPVNGVSTAVKKPSSATSVEPVTPMDPDPALPSLTPDSGSGSPSDVDTPPLSESGDGPNLRQLLQTYTGVAASSILDGSVMAELGLDSLAATEMAEELRLADQGIDGQDLLTMTVKQLEQRLYGLSSRAGKALLGATQALMNGGISETIALPSAPPAKRKGKTKRGEPSAAPSGLQRKLTELIIETTGVAASAIKSSMTLEELGVDSLALTEILSALADAAPAEMHLDTDEIALQSTVGEILQLIGATDASSGDGDEQTQVVSAMTAPAPLVSDLPRMRTDPVSGLHACDAQFEQSARSRGFQRYWTDVAPKQDELVLAYILEAYRALGVDLNLLSEGEQVPRINHLPKHSRLVQRLWDILERHGVVVKGGGDGVFIRGKQSISAIPVSQQVYEELVRDHPAYAIEARLMALTGPKLAECLRGDADPIKLLFGSAAAAKTLEEYYGRSPMLSTLTSQLVAFIMGSAEGKQTQPTRLRILEVGAGTGGTTAELTARLATLNTSGNTRVEYTFTDVSSTMISKAKARFSDYAEWMSFERLDLEKALPSSSPLHGAFDIIIGTNCVHATSDRVSTVRRLRQMLHADGCLVLSEVTRLIDWYDLVFGLLDGWWLSPTYPLQPPSSWMSVFRDAGFPSSTFSHGSTEDANTQHLLIASNRPLSSPPVPSASSTPSPPLLSKHTLVYKTVADLPIHADVYLPPTPPTTPMPIALLIHGGGHMTLTRRAIRPAQVAHLLANNILPVSIDYRLCPELNILDGAMTDVRDALLWARHTLPSLDLLTSRNILVDPSRIVVVGWSTGGHLAMSTAWTIKEEGEKPKAVLCFYAPLDFGRGDVFPRGRPTTVRIPRKLERETVLDMDVSGVPLTGYEVQGAEDPELGWVKAGDVRSELLLSLFREEREFGLGLMLNGGGGGRGGKKVRDLVGVAPAEERVAAMCPTARLKRGEYKVPTFIIHGEQDEIALFESARGFYEELERRGTKAGFLAVKRGGHIHDLRLRPGMQKWDEQVAPGYQFVFDVLNS